MLHFVAPAFVLLQLGLQRFTSRLEWLVSLILATGTVLVLSLIGTWGWFSIFLVPLYWLLLFVAIWRSVRKYESIILFSPVNPAAWLGFSISLFLGALAWAGVLLSFSGQDYPERVVDLAFPFHKKGIYLVGHAGSKPIINYHNRNASQMYALDISKLYPWGGRAKGLYPDMLTEYAIYRTPVFAPCSGKVAAVVNDFPDQLPGRFDRDNPAGNYVAIECAGIVVYLAHFSAGTVMVAKGQRVDRSTRLGLVGNSGNASEPHLHIHAEEGTYPGVFSGSPGLALTFDQRFLVRNSLVFR